jgi:hypothetical protein
VPRPSTANCANAALRAASPAEISSAPAAITNPRPGKASGNRAPAIDSGRIPATTLGATKKKTIVPNTAERSRMGERRLPVEQLPHYREHLPEYITTFFASSVSKIERHRSTSE